MNKVLSKPFYFIRHGQTDWNLRKIPMGHNDIPLNESGIKQANDVKYVLQDLNIGKIVSSPFLRARQTADIINSLLLLPIEYDKDFVERNWETKVSLNSCNSNNNIFGKTENEIEFSKSTLKSINRVLLHEEICLIVAHGGTFVTLSTLIGMNNIEGSDNCIPYLFNPLQNDSWQVIKLKTY